MFAEIKNECAIIVMLIIIHMIENTVDAGDGIYYDDLLWLHEHVRYAESEHHIVTPILQSYVKIVQSHSNVYIVEEEKQIGCLTIDYKDILTFIILS